MPLARPLPGDPTMHALVRQLEQHEDEGAAVRLRGTRADGTTSHVRFTVTRAIYLVQAHVQTAATYDPDSFVSSDEVNVNDHENRIVDLEITRDGVSHYYVFLIPIIEQADGSTMLCDGVSGPDLMSYVDLGI